MKTKRNERSGGGRPRAAGRSGRAARLLAPYRDKALVVIPARYGSTRFRGKPLAEIGGVPMIVRVLDRAAKIRNADAVIVATDDRRIKAAVEEAGGVAVLTAASHPSGTSRVREAAEYFLHGIVINVQGDEPLLPVSAVERLIDAMRDDPRLMMATLASPASDYEDLMRPDVVKVVCDREGDALYFSRSPLPYPGFAAPPAAGAGRSKSKKSTAPVRYLRHIGVYAFRRAFLLGYAGLPRGPLERFERLEQLRALENGYRIRVVACRSASIGVDRPEDIKRVEKRLRSR